MKVPLALFFAASSAFAQHSFTPVDIADGGRLYRANCTICHNAKGDGIAGIDLFHNKFRRAKDDDDIVAIIRSGIPGTAMPPNNFNDFQALTIVGYLRSMAAATQATTSGGDPGRGKTVYDGKGGCASCHRIRGIGSRSGPDLSDVGNLRLDGEIEKSIVDPDAEVLGQNRHFRGVTKEGGNVTGTLLNEDKYAVQILDSDDRLVSVKRANLRESTIIEKSPMPSFKDKLTQTELADLVAYLVAQKGVELR